MRPRGGLRGRAELENAAIASRPSGFGRGARQGDASLSVLACARDGRSGRRDGRSRSRESSIRGRTRRCSKRPLVRFRASSPSLRGSPGGLVIESSAHDTPFGTSSRSVSTETPCQVVSSFDQRVTQWMSTVTASLGRARNSSHVHVTASAPPSIVNVHSLSGVRGVSRPRGRGRSSPEEPCAEPP
jgi:hypothetical protein